MTDEEMIADLRNERIGLAAQVNDRDMRIAWLKAEVYRLRSKLDDAWRCLNPVGQLARHYIAAAAADGDGWRNLKVQAEAAMSLVVETSGGPFTVADLLRELAVVEWRGGYGHWCQFSSSLACRQWNGKRWSPWTTFVVSADDEASTARLVPASEADADPATRGPIGGGA